MISALLWQQEVCLLLSYIIVYEKSFQCLSLQKLFYFFFIVGVKGAGCTSNNTIEMEKTLGIEAARLFNFHYSSTGWLCLLNNMRIKKYFLISANLIISKRRCSFSSWKLLKHKILFSFQSDDHERDHLHDEKPRHEYR